MDYPTRSRKTKRKAPEGERGDNGLELKLAEYSAPCGEERPWRTTTDALELDERWLDLKPERGRLH